MFYKKHKNLLNEKPLLISIMIGLIVSIALLAHSVPVHAAIPVECPDGYQTTVARADQVEAACANHQSGGYGGDTEETGSSKWAVFDTNCINGPEGGNCTTMDKIMDVVDALSAVVGIVVVVMIIVGGIQYSSAGSDPQKIASAKTKIVNALLALLVLIFLWAFLQWIVPGGVFQ